AGRPARDGAQGLDVAGRYRTSPARATPVAGGGPATGRGGWLAVGRDASYAASRGGPCLSRGMPRKGNRGGQRAHGREGEYYPVRGVEGVRRPQRAGRSAGTAGERAGPRDEDRRDGSHADGARDLAHGLDEPGRQTSHRARDTG